MAAYKQFLSSDVIVTPFGVNKGFTFLASEFTDSDVSIDRFEGVNNTFLNNISKTGNNNDQYKVLIYSSVKELYYSNFTTSSYGSEPVSASLLPGETPEGNVLRGPSNSVGRYENYLQSTLTQSRFIPTGSGDRIAAFSVPSRLFGDYIQPDSFIWEDNTNNVTFTDDGEGNLFSGSFQVGNIIYEHGIAILTSASGDFTPDQAVINTNTTCSFKSSFKIYENQYKCTLRESEFNFSLNPSISSGSTAYSSSIGTFYTPSEFLYDFATGSYFSPYISSIGLYDDNQNLLAVAKLSQPLQSSKTTDTTILVNLDL